MEPSIPGHHGFMPPLSHAKGGLVLCSDYLEEKCEAFGDEFPLSFFLSGSPRVGCQLEGQRVKSGSTPLMAIF